MEIKVLSSKEYEEKEKNYGDCIIIHHNANVIVYDCGSEEHAIRVKDFLKGKNINNVYVILSHNDEDHFKGIQWLRENVEIKGIYTILLLKYVDEIYEEINDKRRTREALREQILKLYDNVAKLSGENLKDIYEETINIDGVDIVGPNKDYMITAVAHQLDGRESNQIDSETIFNAISVQVKMNINGKTVLLTGDASYPSIEDKIDKYDSVQLPHHGKKKQAEEIFDKLSEKNSKITYIVSDNTGNSNGGSDDLDTKGKIVYNTKNYGDIDVDKVIENKRSAGTYGREK